MQGLKTSIKVAEYVNPNKRELNELVQLCNSEKQKIEKQFVANAQKRSITMSNVEVSSDVYRQLTDEDEFTQTCWVFVSGTAEKDLSFTTFNRSMSHIKRDENGSYTHACDEISSNYSTNPDEIYQRTEVSWAVFPGNFCTVYSTVLEFSP